MSAELSLSNFILGNNTLTVFIVKKDDENISYFIGNEVARALGYNGDPNQAVRDHCPDRVEYQSLNLGTVNSTVPVIQPRTSMILGPDILNLIWQSQLPRAKEFKKIVWNLLQCVAKYGCYPPPDAVPQLPETQQQHHAGEMERVNKMSDSEKKTERKYKLIEAQATVLEKDSEVRKRGAKTRENNRKAAQTLLAGLLQEKSEWEELQQDYEEHLGWLNQSLFNLHEEKKELKRKNMEKSISILNHIRELRRIELEK